MSKLIHKENQKVLSSDIIFAHNFFLRSKGLIGYKELKPNQCMWIRPCSSIHTCFMKFSIDIIFVDSNLKINKTYENVHPWRVIFGSAISWFLNPRSLKKHFTKGSVFEFTAGHLAEFSLEIGDSLYVDA